MAAGRTTKQEPGCTDVAVDTAIPSPGLSFLPLGSSKSGEGLSQVQPPSAATSTSGGCDRAGEVLADRRPEFPFQLWCLSADSCWTLLHPLSSSGPFRWGNRDSPPVC